MTTDVITQDSHDEHHDEHKMTGIKRWLYTTNHKDIGTLYLWFAFIMFLTGGALAMVIRAELFQPGLQLVEPDFFNQLTTMSICLFISPKAIALPLSAGNAGGNPAPVG